MFTHWHRWTARCYSVCTCVFARKKSLQMATKQKKQERYYAQYKAAKCKYRKGLGSALCVCSCVCVTLSNVLYVKTQGYIRDKMFSVGRKCCAQPHVARTHKRQTQQERKKENV